MKTEYFLEESSTFIKTKETGIIIEIDLASQI